MSRKCTALIVREPNAPTMQQLEENRRRKEMQRSRELECQLRLWARSTCVFLIATIALTGLVLFDNGDSKQVPPGQPATSATAHNVLSVAADKHPIDFDDQSPITEKDEVRHFAHHGGYAHVMAPNRFEFTNRFTGERIKTLGKLRRYELLLQTNGKTLDIDDPSPITDDVITNHQNRHGGVVFLDQQTGYFSTTNRITGEDVSTVGELRRYQVMLIDQQQLPESL